MTPLERALALAQKLSSAAAERGHKVMARRIGEAASLLVDDGVTEIEPGLYRVASKSTPGKTYEVRPGACECPASGFGVKCTHRIASYLYRESHRQDRAGEAQEGQPT